MTREEEIKIQARLYSPNDIGVQGAFEVSAEWADRTMINKACKWLERTLPLRPDDRDEFIEQFKQAMNGD